MDFKDKVTEISKKAGKVATEIGLNFEDSIEFTLTQEIALKKIKLADIYVEKNLPKSGDDEIADAQAELVLQGELFEQLSDYLLEIFDCDRA